MEEQRYSSLEDFWDKYNEKNVLIQSLPAITSKIPIVRLLQTGLDSLLIELDANHFSQPEPLLVLREFFINLKKPLVVDFLLIKWMPRTDDIPILKRYFFHCFIENKLTAPDFELSVFPDNRHLYIRTISQKFFQLHLPKIIFFLERYGISFSKIKITYDMHDVASSEPQPTIKPVVKTKFNPENELNKLGTFNPDSFVAKVLEINARTLKEKIFISIVVEYDKTGIMIGYEGKPSDGNMFAELEINGWYQFRCIKQSFSSVVINKLLRLPTEAKIDLALISFKPAKPYVKRSDNAPEKRIELHLHTKMTSFDGVARIEDILDTAKAWGHSAIAFTDKENIHNFFRLNKLQAKYPEVQIIYGCNINLGAKKIDVITKNTDNVPDGELNEIVYVMLDLETTGLSKFNDEIIEVGMVKFMNHFVVEKQSFFVKTNNEIPEFAFKFTGIDPENYQREAIPQAEAVKKIKKFIKNSILVAHNAMFDVDFLNELFKQQGDTDLTNWVIDTMRLAHVVLPGRKSYKLIALARKYGLEIDRNRFHRAIFDARILCDIFISLISEVKIRKLSELILMNDSPELNKQIFSATGTLLVRNETGLRNLYKLISKSHTETLSNKKKSIVFWEDMEKHKEGLLIGSGGPSGEVFDAAIIGREKDLKAAISRFDFIEIQPLNVYLPIWEKNITSKKNVINAIKRIIIEAKIQNKLLVATGDVYFIDPEDFIFREIFISNKILRGAPHRFFNKEKKLPISPPQYLRTTNEMIESLSYLDNPELAYEMTITNPNLLLHKINRIKSLFATDKMAMAKLENADELLLKATKKGLEARFGKKPPPMIMERFQAELDRVLERGYSTIFLLAQAVGQHSFDNGYLIGSRGSVGSSLLAFCMKISEVNPVAAHYFCRQCSYFELASTEYISGFDLPEKTCPNCKIPLHRDGQRIDFDSFLPSHTGTIPDIDLNFSGRFQSQATKFLIDLSAKEFGPHRIFRAGTISTVKQRTAFSLWRNYLELLKKPLLSYANDRRMIINTCGTKRTTGQHPGGLILIPKEYEVFDFTPYHFPSNNSAEGETTHFDYRALHESLLKLDILGHDDPTGLRLLYQHTGVDPESIPLVEPAVIRIFSSSAALGLRRTDNPPCRTGSLGLPEFGTDFVRSILKEREVKNFSDLISLSGLSHGKNVWENNARSLLKEHQDWTFKDVIACRDDIIYKLQDYGITHEMAFSITNKVRKGKPVTDEQLKTMRDATVPEWFIKSARQIGYLFPKAHATAYSLSAYRFAWYKLYHPAAFYAVYFTLHCTTFELETITSDRETIKIKRKQYQAIPKYSRTPKEQELIGVFEVAEEMLARGIKLLNVDLKTSNSTEFTVNNATTIQASLIAIDNLGPETLEAITTSRAEKPFVDHADLRARGRINSALYHELERLKILETLTKSKQVKFSF